MCVVVFFSVFVVFFRWVFNATTMPSGTLLLTQRLYQLKQRTYQIVTINQSLWVQCKFILHVRDWLFGQTCTPQNETWLSYEWQKYSHTHNRCCMRLQIIYLPEQQRENRNSLFHLFFPLLSQLSLVWWSRIAIKNAVNEEILEINIFTSLEMLKFYGSWIKCLLSHFTVGFSFRSFRLAESVKMYECSWKGFNLDWLN